MNPRIASTSLPLMHESLLHHQEEARCSREALRKKERTLSTLLGNLDGMAYRCRDEFVRAMRDEGMVANFVSQVYRRDGTVIWISENARAVRAADATLLYYEDTVEDISESKRYQTELEYQANYDALTRLPNRNLLKERLQHAITCARREQKGLAVAFMDIDHFKLVNDTLGHHAGDAMLLGVAERVRSALRESDTVARHGGDEFVLLLAGEATEAAVSCAVERVVGALTRPMVLHGREINLTSSIGVALYRILFPSTSPVPTCCCRCPSP